MCEIDQDKVKSVLKYRGGLLFWVSRGSGRSLSQPAGTLRADGYSTICIFGKRYYTHRIIFLYHFGFLPRLVDHINRDNTDNRIENLRAASKSLNSHNSSTVRSSSGVRGVYSNRGKFEARMVVDGKAYFFGSTVDFFEACCMRKSAENRLIGLQAD